MVNASSTGVGGGALTARDAAGRAAGRGPRICFAGHGVRDAGTTTPPDLELIGIRADARRVSMAKSSGGAAAGGGAIYGLGIFGAWVYFWQQADTFWAYVLVLFQGLFWPAWMVYDAFSALNS
jgi:hypothetical protein